MKPTSKAKRSPKLHQKGLNDAFNAHLHAETIEKLDGWDAMSAAISAYLAVVEGGFISEVQTEVEDLKQRAAASSDGKVIISAKTLIESLDLIINQQRQIASLITDRRI